MSSKRISYIASFGASGAKGPSLAPAALGKRGAGLCALARLGLPVPPGFVLNVEACRAVAGADPTALDQVKALIAQGVKSIEAETGFALGDKKQLLLLAVRPSPPLSLPGTLEAVLNLGLNDETVLGLAASAADPTFAHECYRRFMQNYAHVVLGDDPAAFDDLLNLFAEERGYHSPAQIRGTDGPELAARFRAEIEANGGRIFPQNVEDQLWNSVVALARGWNGPRARMQRKLHGLKDDAGLAIVVQAMVFGNQSELSGVGLAASRHPQSGIKELHGLYLNKAQGTDLDMPLRESQPLESLPAPALQTITNALNKLEADAHDAFEVDFTLAQGVIWLLDQRSAKRSTAANLKIITNLVAEKKLSPEEGVMRIDPFALDQLLHSTVAPSAKRDVIGQGLAASPGAATGVISFDATQARTLAAQGQSVILVRNETAPEDIKGLHIAAGVLTTRGGMTSHAAVIARGMGKPCVTGASALRIDANAGTLTAQNLVLKAGEVITIDGSTGQVLKGAVPLVAPSLSDDFATVLAWADKIRRLKVRANAETVHDARIAANFGAEGIGLARAEHMFFEGTRISAIREMIMADSEKERRAALSQILPMLRTDFAELFTIMPGKPVTIRLLDPPLHEFLPTQLEDIEALARSLEVDANAFKKRVLELRENNPMLGHRGVRLLLSYPEITDMQARAIFEAAAAVAQETQMPPIVEIMVPLVASRGELEAVRARIEAVAKDVTAESHQKLNYTVGTMIELPRAALKAADIAQSAEFFSFGTNDLTQTTYGISRDDSARFIGEYTKRGIFESDPFVSLDIDGVGELISLAVERGRKGRANIMLGVCGEHGGDPDSIAFFEEVGLDYVSCSPFRVPVARLAAAQAHLKFNRK